MRRLLITFFLSAVSLCAYAEQLPADCSFDQAFVAHQLRALAARTPGGVVNLKESKVSWRLTSGEIVEAGQGGCYDLGVGISVVYVNGRPPTDQAVRQLLAVVSKCRSKRDSQEIAAILAARKFETEVLANGEIELLAPKIPGSSFLLGGFSIILPESEISISWQSG